MKDLNSREHFNHLYSKVPLSEGPPLSLLTFFNDLLLPKLTFKDRLDILELGSGPYSLFEWALPNEVRARVLAIDFSPVAIAEAQRRAPEQEERGQGKTQGKGRAKSEISKDERIEYALMDIAAKDWPGKKEGFDLVFDSHCLHTVVDPLDRWQSFKNISHSLKPQGLFAAEMMIQPKGEQVELALKHIPSAYDLEKEILAHGFKLEYFTVSWNLHFLGGEKTCDMVRVIARK